MLRKECLKAFFERTRNYKVTVSLMIISFVIAYCSVFFVVTFNVNIAREYNDKVEYAYKSQCSFSYTSLMEKDMEIFHNVVDCNLKLVNSMVYMNQSQEIRIMDVIINSESENYPFVEGGIPEDITDIKMPSVILGISLKPYTYVEDGIRYTDIIGEKYMVLGFVSTGTSVMYDYKVVTFWDNMTDKLRDTIEANLSISAEFQLESNKLDCQEEVDKIKKVANIFDEKSEVVVRNASAVPQVSVSRMNILIYIFAFLSMIITVKFWIWERDKELAIRNVYGYTGWDIFNLIYKDVTIYSMIGLAISLALMGGFNWGLAHYSLEYNIEFDWIVIVGMFVGSLATSLCLCLFQIGKIARINPNKLLRDKV